VFRAPGPAKAVLWQAAGEKLSQHALDDERQRADYIQTNGR